VLVTNGIIERIGRSSDPVPEGARTVDLAGRMLIPGLINIHIHVQGRRPQPDHGAEPLLAGTPAHFLQARLRDTLRMGVTMLRNVGSQALEPQEARQAMRYGAFRGPRLLTCGLIISATSPGGRFYGAMYREADGPDEVRKAVREQLRDGADFIKVMTTGARSNELEDPSRPSSPIPSSRRPCQRPIAWASRWLPTSRDSTGPRRRSGTASTRSSTVCTSTSVPSCSSRWPRRAR